MREVIMHAQPSSGSMHLIFGPYVRPNGACLSRLLHIVDQIRRVPALLTYHRLLTLIKKSIFIVFSAALSMNFGIEFHLYMDHDMDNCQQ